MPKNENYEEGASKDITNMKNFFEIFDFKNCNFDPSIIRGWNIIQDLYSKLI